MPNLNMSPWDFPDTIEAPPGSNNTHKITYRSLGEIAMGAPLGGQCFLENDKEKILIHEWCGGPPVWETKGAFVAIPIWTRQLLKGTVQQIGIIDMLELELKIFAKTFRVLDLRSFKMNMVLGYDSPIYNRTDVVFDIGSEKIDTEIKLIR